MFFCVSKGKKCKILFLFWTLYFVDETKEEEERHSLTVSF